MRKGEKCLICSNIVDYIGHHVRSKGAAGKHIDELWNLMPICSSHHTMGRRCVHTMGLKSFANEYPQVKRWLIENKWEECKLTGKWFNEKYQ